MQKVSPFLWFHDNNAAEAADFYHSIFPNSRIVETRHWGHGAPQPEGSVLAVTIEIEGAEYVFFNGGPYQQLNPSISLFVRCQTQAEVDRYWDALVAGGKPIQCGWLTDKFGLSWQIIPDVLGRLIDDKQHPQKAAAAMKAMMSMIKIDIAALEAAYNAAP